MKYKQIWNFKNTGLHEINNNGVVYLNRVYEYYCYSSGKLVSPSRISYSVYSKINLLFKTYIL